ncbi:ABC transporter ATP-binding protein [Streptomyces sudanensis]|uniref:ABC transporter ATP-binding protein n=1 Tax=Streptomyces sudanensis TaxID=436397 RepID=UPI0020CF6F98|nr:ABC transporter ATP-binding protein [Streptomyces sudanensis]MCP9957543.1 ABC transporter ATP-binding protein [Streptomyces sudanensis]MCP9986676.1 ABC transporter ATP-binding protein [Streptomyces sudanensis]MCQ0001914.1 ABC transporter ATP-binding protein [Streptomyces sudanensis]
MPVHGTVIELRGIGKVYPGISPVRALDDVSLTISAGELTAIVGPSGSGKSTLLSVLGLLDSPTEGHYLLQGTSTTTLTERERTHLRAQTLGFVFQAFHLVPHLTCIQNVALGLVHQGVRRSRRSALAVQALESVGLSHRLSAKPSTLSGGERQRVAVARAIVHRPAVVLCDEPTGNLDTVNSARVMELLRGLVAAERAVVVVTHDMDVAARADRTIRVVDGRAV